MGPLVITDRGLLLWWGTRRKCVASDTEKKSLDTISLLYLEKLNVIQTTVV